MCYNRESTHTTDAIDRLIVISVLRTPVLEGEETNSSLLPASCLFVWLSERSA